MTANWAEFRARLVNMTKGDYCPEHPDIEIANLALILLAVVDRIQGVDDEDSEPLPAVPAEPPEYTLTKVVTAEDGVIRFQENPIVRFLLDAGPFDLNQLACMEFPRWAREQFAQLIGYSVSGFGDLSYARAGVVALADQLAEKLIEEGK
jgi:hypothetical protein